MQLLGARYAAQMLIKRLKKIEIVAFKRLLRNLYPLNLRFARCISGIRVVILRPERNVMHATHNKLKTTICSAFVCSGLLGLNVAFAQTTTDPEALFSKGLKSRAAGELQESIEAFQSILSIEPTLQRARLELAISYFKALNYAEARRQAQQVLDDPATPDAVKENIRRFLQDIALAPSANPARDQALTVSAGISHRYLSPSPTAIAGKEATFG